ncbi:EF-hand domain-containing protein [Bradyrhizobium sp. sBnM-33]|nr:EF-hand domain-containing protein [Bradyrhizobium sp. sBnM-33]WOH53163.1 EF-hand domain-containing protein [Bradyrhizobium sp. sBnM-33]
MLLGGSNAVLSQQSAPQQYIVPPGEQLLLSRLPSGSEFGPYLYELRAHFFHLDADTDGKLTQRDIDLHTLMEAIQARTIALNSIMRLDLDGDGAVTEDEIRRTTRYDRRGQVALAASNSAGKKQAADAEEQIENYIRSVMALDTDKDGKVSFSEAGMYGEPSRRRAAGQGGLSALVRQAMTLATQPPYELTLVDYQAAGEALFRKIDSDNDFKISQQELTGYRRKPEPPDAAVRDAAAEAAKNRLAEQAEIARKKQEAVEAERSACAMPKASDKARVVLFSGYQTEALSSVTLGSQDVVVHAGRVVVEPGPEPLYIVISTYSATIWQISGATERIERIVLSSSRTGPKGANAQRLSLVGATGIAPERVVFFSRSDCLGYFYESPSSSSIQTVATVRNATGKEPEVVASKYSVSSFAVPSGKIETVRAQGQPLVIEKSQGTLKIVGNSSDVIVQAGPSRARDEMYRFFPGGVIDIDPKTVVASVPPAAYEVLPSQAGLVQLLSTGAVTQNRMEEYIVRQKIRFPPGLAGAHSVTFLIMKGTPYPDGDPAHSCVIMEETGERKGAACRSR